MIDKRAELAEKIRAIQGQSPPVEVAGKMYVFTKLRRRDCQETLYNLIKPLIRIVSSVIEQSDFKVGDLGDPEKFDLTKNVGLVAEIIDLVPYDQLHQIAKKILKDVIIDNVIAPDDFENPDVAEPGYYDDKQMELLQAIMKGIQVNYPFLGGLIMKKGKTKEDSDQSKETMKTG